MTLGDMISTIRSMSGKVSVNNLDDTIRDDINRVYRGFATRYIFNGLIQEDESFTTVASTYAYYLPYRLLHIIPESLRYDVTSTDGGRIIPIGKNRGTVQLFKSLTTPVSSPMYASIIGGNGTPLLLTTAQTSISNGTSGIQFASLVGLSVGDSFIIGQDSVENSGGDYGYRTTDILVPMITPNYRGPDLKTGTPITVRPGNTKRLQLVPDFTESGKAVEYSWAAAPQRLYNLSDIPEVPELCDAIIYRVLLENPTYHRPEQPDRAFYEGMSRHYLNTALLTAQYTTN